ncbi:hypothetical protein HYS72_01430 [Candidatus Pacearchaeota archaeon]|nr:hypothetical protein [Candidatus Pacearchaeota archaeon]MBI2057281.1 hypothetical protein [Candidatus Pacearchaeota archaeon]
MNTIVIDTNIFISSLIKEGLTREIITNSKINFLFPEFELEEIYSHKEEIIKIPASQNLFEFFQTFVKEKF